MLEGDLSLTPINGGKCARGYGRCVSEFIS